MDTGNGTPIVVNDLFRKTKEKQDKYTMDPGSQIDRSNQKIIFSKK